VPSPIPPPCASLGPGAPCRGRRPLLPRRTLLMVSRLCVFWLSRFPAMMTRAICAAQLCSPSAPSCPVTTSTSSWVLSRDSPLPLPSPSPDTSSTNLGREGSGSTPRSQPAPRGCREPGVGDTSPRPLWLGDAVGDSLVRAGAVPGQRRGQVGEAVILHQELAVVLLGAVDGKDGPCGREWAVSPPARASEVTPTEKPSSPTCHQPLHLDGSFQLDPLQLVLQDQLVGGVDVLGQGRLRDQVVLGGGTGQAVTASARAFPAPAKPRSWQAARGRVTGEPPVWPTPRGGRGSSRRRSPAARQSAGPVSLGASPRRRRSEHKPGSPAKEGAAQPGGGGRGSGSPRGNLFAIIARASAPVPLRPARQARG